MKFILVGFVPFYLILFRCVGVLAWSLFSNGSSNNNVTEYELKLDTRSDTEHCKYYKCDLDGLESHLLYTKSDHVVSKIMDGNIEMWTKPNNLQFLAGVFSYKNNEQKLGLVVLMSDAILTNPLELKRFKFNNNRWEEVEKSVYFNELKSLVPQNQNPDYKELDLSKENELAKFSEVAKSKLCCELFFYIPQQGYRLNKITDGSNKVWERGSSNSEYGLSCLIGKFNDQDKFVVMILRSDTEYQEKFFYLENNKWKCVDWNDFKIKLLRAYAKSKLNLTNNNTNKQTNNKSDNKNPKNNQHKPQSENEQKQNNNSDDDDDDGWGNFLE